MRNCLFAIHALIVAGLAIVAWGLFTEKKMDSARAPASSTVTRLVSSSPMNTSQAPQD